MRAGGGARRGGNRGDGGRGSGGGRGDRCRLAKSSSPGAHRGQGCWNAGWRGRSRRSCNGWAGRWACRRRSLRPGARHGLGAGEHALPAPAGQRGQDVRQQHERRHSALALHAAHRQQHFRQPRKQPRLPRSPASARRRSPTTRRAPSSGAIPRGPAPVPELAGELQFRTPEPAVVRNVSLYYPNWFGFLVAKPCKTAKFFNPLNVFPMSPVNVTAPFLVQKALKTENSEKWASKFARFPPKTCSRCLQCSEIRILPRKNLRIPAR